MITNNSKGEINMKKLICLLVICANLVGVAVNVSAYSDYDTEETRFLRIMDIMNGYEDGTFKPYNVLTRSEAIRIVDDMMGFSDETSYTGKENSDLPFSDISKDSWDWKYWNYAYCNSVISGFEDGTARPNDNVTYAQFVKMLVTSIGYDFYSEAVGGYPNGYFKYAENFNITDDINLNYDDTITRASAALLAQRTMNTPIMEFISKPISTILSEQKSEFVESKIYNGTGADYRTLLTKKKSYNADVIIESISGDITTAKIVNARNFCDKEYNGTENYSFELNTNGYELSENEKYNVVVECVDNNYILKFVYESDI